MGRKELDNVLPKKQESWPIYLTDKEARRKKIYFKIRPYRDLYALGFWLQKGNLGLGWWRSRVVIKDPRKNPVYGLSYITEDGYSGHVSLDVFKIKKL